MKYDVPYTLRKHLSIFIHFIISSLNVFFYTQFNFHLLELPALFSASLFFSSVSPASIIYWLIFNTKFFCLLSLLSPPLSLSFYFFSLTSSYFLFTLFLHIPFSDFPFLLVLLNVFGTFFSFKRFLRNKCSIKCSRIQLRSKWVQ